MSTAQLFALCNLVVLPAWILLAVLPAWKWTRVLAAYVTPGLLTLVYVGAMITRFEPVGGGFGSIDQIAAMFQDQWLLLAGWVHLLALDVFVGAWEVRDAQRLEVPHLYVVPCLVLTFLLGPVGLVAYFMVRGLVVRKMPGAEPPTSHRRRTPMPGIRVQ